jgi:hypothetical protein
MLLHLPPPHQQQLALLHLRQAESSVVNVERSERLDPISVDQSDNRYTYMDSFATHLESSQSVQLLTETCCCVLFYFYQSSVEPSSNSYAFPFSPLWVRIFHSTARCHRALVAHQSALVIICSIIQSNSIMFQMQCSFMSLWGD